MPNNLNGLLPKKMKLRILQFYFDSFLFCVCLCFLRYRASLPVSALVSLSASVKQIILNGANLIKAGVNPEYRTIGPSALIDFTAQSNIPL